VPDTIAVHLNRDGPRSLETPSSFRTDGSFDLEVTNHGPGTHVHIQLDDALVDAMALEGGNHYVESGTTHRIRATVGDIDGPVDGTLRVVTGYGSEEAAVDVELDTPGPGPVEVDESLAQPQPSTESSGGSLPDLSWLPVVALGLVAILLAAGAVVTTPGNAVTLGALAVVAGVLAAVYILLR